MPRISKHRKEASNHQWLSCLQEKKQQMSYMVPNISTRLSSQTKKHSRLLILLKQSNMSLLSIAWHVQCLQEKLHKTNVTIHKRNDQHANNRQCPHCIKRKHLTGKITKNIGVHVPQKHQWSSISVGLSSDEEWQQKEQACWACTWRWACRSYRYTWD